MSDERERTVILKVEGMSCEHCAGRVQKALDAAPGVAGASVDLAAGTASVRLAGDAESAGLIAAVEQAGYKAHAA